MTQIKITLSNSYTLIGPKENKLKAREIVKEMEREMKSEFRQAMENSGESAAMDARDDVYWEFGFRESLMELGFEMEEED